MAEYDAAKKITGLQIQVAGRSAIGLKRAVNQDAFRTHIPIPEEIMQHAIFVLADGVGGNLPHGEVASRVAVDKFIEVYATLPPTLDVFWAMRTALEIAHEAVKVTALDLGVVTIGTTFAGVAITPAGEVVVANVGDSRVYRMRSKTLDRISQDQVSGDPHGNAKRVTKISSFLGQSKTLEPNFFRLEAQAGDVFLICSDGIWSLISDQEMEKLLREKSIDELADRLVQLVHERNAPDNLTLILVKVGANPPSGGLFDRISSFIRS